MPANESTPGDGQEGSGTAVETIRPIEFTAAGLWLRECHVGAVERVESDEFEAWARVDLSLSMCGGDRGEIVATLDSAAARQLAEELIVAAEAAEDGAGSGADE